MDLGVCSAIFQQTHYDDGLQHSQFPPEGLSLVLGKLSLDVWVSFAFNLILVSLIYQSRPHFRDRKFGR